MESEESAVEIVEQEQAESNSVETVALDSAQYETIVAVLEQTRQKTEENAERMYSVWLLLAILVLLELRRVTKGITKKWRRIAGVRNDD